MPKLSKGIKQDDMSSCMACVAAMATGTTVQEFRAFVGDKEPPYHDADFVRYLLKHGLFLGIGAPNLTEVDGKLKAITFWELEEYPALVSVKSERHTVKEHALYWDGYQLWDPNPGSKDGGDPRSYHITGWYPITSAGMATPLD